MKKIFNLIAALIIINSTIAQTTAAEWFVKGKALYNEKKYTEAIIPFEKAVELKPDYKDAMFKLGWCYNDASKFSDAIKVLKNLTAIDSKNYEAFQELGYAYKKSKLFTDAQVALQKAVEIKPTYALAYKQLGDVYSELKQKDKAIDSYNVLKMIVRMQRQCTKLVICLMG
jgi:tetratricopeptide (TPR) repeat protein